MSDALIVLGMGGPESVETIRPFLFNLFSDREIIDFHIGNFCQTQLAKVIASKRSKKIAPEYLKMGFHGASPQNVHTKALLKKLPTLYKNKTGRSLETFGAMCYFHPFIAETAEIISKNEFDKVIILPMYPQYSITTTGACFSKLYKHFNLFAPKTGRLESIPYWYKDDGYCNCIIKRINEGAKKLGKELAECHVLFSAHSIPEKMLSLGDPYVNHIEDHAKILSQKAGLKNWDISYQSKVGPVKWVGPATVNKLEELKNSRTNNIIVVPIAFVSDHIETLIELDEQLIPKIREAGINIVRSESLNADDDFALALTDIITGDYK